MPDSAAMHHCGLLSRQTLAAVIGDFLIMTSNSARAVPQELAERIIDYIHDDPPALRSCALVCHSWLKHSRIHLFRCIAVSFDSDGSSNLSDATLPVIRDFGKEMHWGNVAINSPRLIQTLDVFDLVNDISPIIPVLNHRFSIDFTAGTDSLVSIKELLDTVPNFARCVREVEWTFRTGEDMVNEWQLTRSLGHCFRPWAPYRLCRSGTIK
jgi:hypothetical protein